MVDQRKKESLFLEKNDKVWPVVGCGGVGLAGKLEPKKTRTGEITRTRFLDLLHTSPPK